LKLTYISYLIKTIQNYFSILNRIMKTSFLATICVLSFISYSSLYGQIDVSGIIQTSNGERLVGAYVTVENTISGTITDENGFFKLHTNEIPPFKIIVSYLGFEGKIIQVDDSNFDLGIIEIKEENGRLNEIVVSASKIEESYMEVPISIEKLTLQKLRSSPAFDAYSSLSNIQGVQPNIGSFTFTSYNTRGFADMQNWRFVQLVDGMDVSLPGLNYPIGGNSGPAEIEISSMELIPGANSALYGANAFNGLLSINTKNPFHYQGLSLYTKTGFTSQRGVSTNPLLDIGFRYAKSFNEKLAIGLSFSTTLATDWTANNESFHITNSRYPFKDSLLSLPRNHPNFDAVNVYGDHVQTMVSLDGSEELVPINRTGIREADLVDYNIQTYKGSGTIRYLFRNKLEAVYNYRMVASDGILRHTSVYPFVNFSQQFHRLEFNRDDFLFRCYLSLENFGNIYATQVAGEYIETNRKSNEDWASDYGEAFRGYISSVPANDHNAARQYADRDLIPITSDIFETLRAETLGNVDLSNGGSKFFERSKFFHIDTHYKVTPLSKYLNLQVGASFRRYAFYSNGNVFNDGPLGFGAPIPMIEYGIYTQAMKSFIKNRLKFIASLRIDKNQNFRATLTPRLSLVMNIDENKKHFLRTSYQTGFRNPGSLESYTSVDAGPVIILGGVEDNLENYTIQKVNGDYINGKELHANLYTLDSYLNFLETGNQNGLVLARLPYISQEKNSTIEVGYKGFFRELFFININYYHTFYKNFAVRINTASQEVERYFAVYTNVKNDIVTSSGIGLQLDYFLTKNLDLGLGYTFSSFDAEEAVANNPGFLPSFNTPKHRFNLSASFKNIAGTKLGLTMTHRWSDNYTWQSPFGEGDIQSFSVTDLALSYPLKSWNSYFKMGASNVLNQGYNTVYGGPNVGAIYFISWIYDPLIR